MRLHARPFVLYGTLTAAVALSGSFAYGAVSSGGTKTATSSRTVTVQAGTVSQVISADGTVEPAADLTIDFATSGTVSEVDVAPGATVAAGQLLARLDPTTAQEQLDIANLNLSGAQTKLAQAEAGTTTSGGGASSAAASAGASPATVDADQVALDDAQKAAAVNANGYQLAIDQAQGDLAAAQQRQADDQQQCAADATSPACGKAADDADAVRRADDAVANANQAQAAGLQRDQQAVHEAEAKLAADQASARGSQAPAAPSATVDASAVASAKANVLSAQNQVAAAQRALDATTLDAPTAGTITTVNVAVGDQVAGGGTSSAASTTPAATSGGAGGNGSNGANGSSAAAATSSASSTAAKAFGTLIDTTGYTVAVAIPEADAPKVAAGQPATITVGALDGTDPLTGTVASVAATATTTGNVVSYKTEVTVVDPPASLRPGMSATVAIAVATKQDVLAVPTAAITTRAGTSYVNKLVGGKPVETTVTTGLQGDSTTEITSGLSAGDQVVIQTATVAATANPTRTTGAGTLTGVGGGGGGFPGGGGGFPRGGQQN